MAIHPNIERFQHLRGMLKITQMETAKVLGISQRTVSDYHRGVKIPSIAVLDLLEFELKERSKEDVNNKNAIRVTLDHLACIIDIIKKTKFKSLPLPTVVELLTEFEPPSQETVPNTEDDLSIKEEKPQNPPNTEEGKQNPQV